MKEKTGDEYAILTSNLETDFFKLFSYNAHIICNITNERVTNENKMLLETKRYMNFRDNGYVTAGGRFSHFEEKYELSAKNYMSAVLDAIKYARGEDISDDELKIAQDEEMKEKETNAKEFAKTEEKIDVDLVIDTAKKKYADASEETKNKVKTIFKDNGYKNFTEVKTQNNIDHIKSIAILLDVEI